MVEVFYISDWIVKKWVQTGGSREKIFIENPNDGNLYFFKKSIDKFPSEFWSEIISSKLGSLLGFNMLDYNIAIYNDEVGCLCKSMINQSNEELEHGIGLIKKNIPNFKVIERPIILFSYVEKSFLRYPSFINKFIDIIIFDSIIGNQDRHSENWAIIRSLDINDLKSNKQRLIKWAITKYKEMGLSLSQIPFKKFFLQILDEAFLVNVEFSPIYDSGSSLGREISEELIQSYLENENKMKKYILKGKSEVRWEDSKINHFDLIKRISEKYPTQVNKTINRVYEKYNKTTFHELIENIDEVIDCKYEKSKLSLPRKQLIVKLVELRIKLLKDVLN